MIGLLINAIKVLFVLGFLITIHEGGHFLIAKLCKVRVNDFSIGFGPIIFKKKKAETLYTLRLIPLGGFVRLEGEEEASNVEGSFSKAPILNRIAIVVAGASVNIIFALIVYFVLISYNGKFITTTIDSTMENYGAQVAGIQSNDVIKSINGKKVRFKKDIDKIMSKQTGENLSIEVERNNEKIVYDVKPTEDITRNIGIYFGNANEEISSKIEYVYPDSPASEFLKQGDIIKQVDGIDVNSDPYKVVELINAQDGDVNITIERKGEILSYTMTPVVIKSYYLGVVLKSADDKILTRIYYGFFDTVDFSLSIIDNLKLLFTGNVSVNQMVGPIGISELVVKTSGLYDFIYLLALISLSLGVTNLLPFPPLDGGKIVLLIIEGIRKKTLNHSFELGLQLTGFFVLMSLSIYVSYNDFVRIFIK